LKFIVVTSPYIDTVACLGSSCQVPLRNSIIARNPMAILAIMYVRDA